MQKCKNAKMQNFQSHQNIFMIKPSASTKILVSSVIMDMNRYHRSNNYGTYVLMMKFHFWKYFCIFAFLHFCISAKMQKCKNAKNAKILYFHQIKIFQKSLGTIASGQIILIIDMMVVYQSGDQWCNPHFPCGFFTQKPGSVPLTVGLVKSPSGLRLMSSDPRTRMEGAPRISRTETLRMG